MNNGYDVVVDGRRRRIQVGEQSQRHYCIRVGDGEGSQILINSNRKRVVSRLLQDIALIQEHFGDISRSAAGRIAIALTANAIRKNKALPDLTDGVSHHGAHCL
jgi:hypothetical protein